MRLLLAIVSLLLLLQLPSLAEDQIDFPINVGGPAAVIDEPPEFLYPPELGFGVAVGTPYDLFYLNGAYFLHRGGNWFKAPYYGGSWTRVGKKKLPRELRANSIARIHQYRDREFRLYQADRKRYPGPNSAPDVSPAGGEDGAAKAPEVKTPGERVPQDTEGNGPAESPAKEPSPGVEQQEMRKQEPVEKPLEKPELNRPRQQPSPEVIPI
ncbi:MAG TPA: hypothetical protein VJ550_09765 [Geomonas sp.]|nr:hypothetical protein [Geomonas sp.]